MSNLSHASASQGAGLTQDEKFVILASSTGTIFEWYDFYVYAVLAPVLAAVFFPAGNPTWALLGALGALAAGFIVRPFGALFFGRIGDLLGRKHTFLITILVMGLSTFLVGCLPTYAVAGGLAPILLLLLRLIQGLAIGGEYGGAATYVAEHARNGRRGYATSWIQTTATLGFFLALVVIFIMRKNMLPANFAGWGWRIPFLASALLLVFSLWIRLRLDESPVFQKMKAEGKRSLTPIRDSLFKSPNNKFVLFAILGATMGQGVVWYTAQFHALFFLSGPLKANWDDAYLIMAVAVLLATPFFVVFGALSDRIGRLKLILAGCLIGAFTYFPLFHLLATAVNPDLAKFNETAKVSITADPAQCHFVLIPLPGVTPSGDCDTGRSLLTANGINFEQDAGPAGSKATLSVNGTKVEGFSPLTWSKALADAGYPHLTVAAAPVTLTKDQTDALTKAQADKNAAAATGVINDARKAADPAAKPLAPLVMIDAPQVGADGGSTVNVTQVVPGFAKSANINYVAAIAIIWVMMIYVTLVYGPIAAYLVELFPSNVRYTSMSFPYHIGNGWFGGLLPLFATAYMAYTGNVFAGTWYPVIFAGLCFIFGLLLLRETKEVDIAKT